MYNNLEKQTSNDYYTKLSTKTNNKHKHTNSYLPTKLTKNKKNIFSIFNNNNINGELIKSKISSNENISPVKTNLNLNSRSLKRQSSLLSNISNSSLNQSLYSNSFNLINLLKINKIIKQNGFHFLPNINNIENNTQNENSIKIKKNNNEFIENSKFYDRTKKNKSAENDKSKKYDKFEHNINSYKSSNKYLNMKTFINLKNQIQLLNNDNKLPREYSEEKGIKAKTKKEEKEEKEGKEQKGIKNKKLLYSKKYHNYIIKIYKKIENKQKNNKEINEGNGTNNYQNIMKSSKIYKKEYFNFDPKKYIKKFKHKIKSENIGNSKISKTKLINKTYDYIEYTIIKKNKINNIKQDIFEKIKENNKNLISKCKKEFLQKLIDETLLKINIKHKKGICKLYIEMLLISKYIHIFNCVKLNIIKYMLTISENDDLYFINLVKKLLYSENKQFSIRYSFIKNLYDKDYFFKNIIELDKFLFFNDKKIYYLYFLIKFQLLDCETILGPYKEKKFKFYAKKYIKAKNISSSIEKDKNESIQEKSSDKFSTIGKRIKIKNSKKYINLIKYNPSSKLMNINLTKNIINLRKINIEETLKNKKLFNINNLKKCNLNKIIKRYCNSSSEYSKASNKIIKKIINDNDNDNNSLNSNSSINDDNEEIHRRDKQLFFVHFFSFIKFSQYNKLYNWLKSYSKYIDLNYKLDNGDTLLHLCIRYSVPDYIIKFLIYKGVNINSQNNEGDTALHLAVKNHNYRSIDLLIKMGASEFIYNKMCKNCWEGF